MFPLFILGLSNYGTSAMLTDRALADENLAPKVNIPFYGEVEQSKAAIALGVAGALFLPGWLATAALGAALAGLTSQRQIGQVRQGLNVIAARQGAAPQIPGPVAPQSPPMASPARFNPLSFLFPGNHPTA
jgi:hypothetical protein